MLFFRSLEILFIFLCFLKVFNFFSFIFDFFFIWKLNYWRLVLFLIEFLPETWYQNVPVDHMCGCNQNFFVWSQNSLKFKKKSGFTVFFAQKAKGCDFSKGDSSNHIYQNNVFLAFIGCDVFFVINSRSWQDFKCFRDIFPMVFLECVLNKPCSKWFC